MKELTGTAGGDFVLAATSERGREGSGASLEELVRRPAATEAGEEAGSGGEGNPSGGYCYLHSCMWCFTFIINNIAFAEKAAVS